MWKRAESLSRCFLHHLPGASLHCMCASADAYLVALAAAFPSSASRPSSPPSGRASRPIPPSRPLPPPPIRSWNIPRAIKYREIHRISGLKGTAVNVQVGGGVRGRGGCTPSVGSRAQPSMSRQGVEAAGGGGGRVGRELWGEKGIHDEIENDEDTRDQLPPSSPFIPNEALCIELKDRSGENAHRGRRAFSLYPPSLPPPPLPLPLPCLNFIIFYFFTFSSPPRPFPLPLPHLPAPGPWFAAT